MVRAPHSGHSRCFSGLGFGCVAALCAASLHVFEQNKWRYDLGAYSQLQLLHSLSVDLWIEGLRIGPIRCPVRHSMTVHPDLLLLHDLQDGVRFPS